MPGYPCCCEEPPPHEIGFPCPTCAGDKPRFITLELEGIPNESFCSQCASLNTAYELEQDTDAFCQLLGEDCLCLWGIDDANIVYCPENTLGQTKVGPVGLAICWNNIEDVIKYRACIQSFTTGGIPDFYLLFGLDVPSTSPPDCMTFNRLQLPLTSNQATRCRPTNPRCFITSGVLA